jgi:hypothetical protein
VITLFELMSKSAQVPTLKVPGLLNVFVLPALIAIVGVAPVELVSVTVAGVAAIRGGWLFT